MRYLLTGKEAKAIDSYSINRCKIPSVVLMERAALAVRDCILKVMTKKGISFEDLRIIFVCGNGNNGADGIAAARQLLEIGTPKQMSVLEMSDEKGTAEYELQKDILKNIGVNTCDKAGFSEYNIIVDAIFGIGLSRNVTGKYAQIIKSLNESVGCVISVDISSGIDAGSGNVLGIAVKADYTVTFGYEKIGMIVYPGAGYAGIIHRENIGFVRQKMNSETAFCFDDSDLTMIPERKNNSNKGTYGKVFVVAGSKDMGGAACLSALSAYNTGCGLVKVYTHCNNRDAVLNFLPEAIVQTYSDETDENIIQKDVYNGAVWADSVVCGPGISVGKKAEIILKYIMEYCNRTLILDADALNIIASDKNKYVIKKCKAMVIVTPHVGEMSRLTGHSISEIKSSFVDTAVSMADENKCVCVLKDARSIVTDGTKKYINVSGNNGMSTGGSGDVLTGVIASLSAMGMSPFDAACMGAYVHGRSGDAACENVGRYSMKAGDIANSIHCILEKL